MEEIPFPKPRSSSLFCLQQPDSELSWAVMEAQTRKGSVGAQMQMRVGKGGMSRKCPKWGWRKRREERRRSKEVGVHDSLNTSEVSSGEASFQLVYLLACFALSKGKQLKKNPIGSQAVPICHLPSSALLSFASAAAICHRLSGNRDASTLFHLSVAKLLLFSGGQRTQFAPSKRAGRGWGRGQELGPGCTPPERVLSRERYPPASSNHA